MIEEAIAQTLAVSKRLNKVVLPDHHTHTSPSEANSPKESDRHNPYVDAFSHVSRKAFPKSHLPSNTSYKAP